MLRRFSVDFSIFSMLVDGALVSASLKLSLTVRPEISDIFSFTRPLPHPPALSAWIYPVFSVMWVLVLMLFSTYDGRKNLRLIDELTNLSLGSLLAAVSLAGLLYLSYRDMSRALFLFFILFTFICMFLVRLIYRMAFRFQVLKGVQTRNILIIGAGITGKRIAQSINQYQSQGLNLIGFLDDDPVKQKHKNVLGNLTQTRETILRHHIDDVVLTLPSIAFTKINKLVTELHDLPVRVLVVPDYYSLALNQARVDDFAGVPMIDLRAPALDNFQRLVKRAMDILITLIALPFTLPLMGLIALCIRLDSPGPVIFRQKRVGENERVFEMYKFRTMVDGADKKRSVIESVDENGHILQDKTKIDPRITRFGSILRRTSLDELPQLYNVFRGEMSIVGPRPEMPHLVAQYQPWQRQRFAVPQGMTGWWQINGRSDKPMHLHTEDDLYYVQNYSIWLDLIILLKTVWVVFRRKGAY